MSYVYDPVRRELAWPEPEQTGPRWITRRIFACETEARELAKHLRLQARRLGLAGMTYRAHLLPDGRWAYQSRAVP